MNVLVTFVEWREKYKAAIGNCAFIDTVIDCSQLGNKDKYIEKNTGFTDRLDALRPCSYHELEEKIVKISSPTFYILFPRPTKECLNIVELFCEYGTVNVILNKGFRLKFPFYKIILRFLVYFSMRFFIKNKKIEINNLFTHDVMLNYKVISFFSYKNVVKIKAMDYPLPLNKDIRSSKVGVFYDSYIPFHNELYLYRGCKISAEDFYKRLNCILFYLKNVYGLSDIYFSRHPNSKGEEIRYINEDFLTDKKTKELSLCASYHWAFGSDALFLSCSMDNYLCCIDFPDLLPKDLSKYIKRKSILLGADYFVAYDNLYEFDTMSSSSRKKKRAKVLGATGYHYPLLSDVLEFNSPV